SSATADLVRRALEEDGASRDVTSLSLVPADATASADLLARPACRVAGVAVAELAFKTLDPSLSVEKLVRDGDDVAAGTVLLRVRGSARSILSAERTALNLAQRMTGIATATARYVALVAGTGCKILDTRKTAPGMRALDKYSVKAGGGTNHRMGLADMVLVKDNHRKLWRGGDSSRLDMAVAAARAAFPGIPVEVEVESFEELRSALAGSPEWIMLDNMPPPMMAEAVKIVAGRCKLEASGGIDETTVRAAAETGVDAISIGALTHSVKAVDLSLEFSIA
ncbi:MAG: carboxylating nicotinate-nucleotide diphosphorylase, partial [Kiritimatiellae bacterium]|nr:carboxylating nicotinate-nucleotide diphosphorylase [Kiritimatiellia bacterium]